MRRSLDGFVSMIEWSAGSGSRGGHSPYPRCRRRITSERIEEQPHVPLEVLDGYHGSRCDTVLYWIAAVSRCDFLGRWILCMVSPSSIGTGRSLIERVLRKEPARLFLVHDATEHVTFDCYVKPRTTEIRSCSCFQTKHFESNPCGLHHSRRLPLLSPRSSSSSMMEEEWQQTKLVSIDGGRTLLVRKRSGNVPATCPLFPSFAGAVWNHKSQLKNDGRPKLEKKSERWVEKNIGQRIGMQQNKEWW